MLESEVKYGKREQKRRIRKNRRKINEENKKSLRYKIIYIRELVIKFFFWIRGVFLNFWNSKCNIFKILWKTITNRRCLTFFTLILAVGTFGMAYYTKGLAQSNNEMVEDNRDLVNSNEEMVKLSRKTVQDNRKLIESNNKMLDLTSQANERSEKLFVGQNKPIIDVTPIGIVQTELIDEKKTKMCTTLFSVVNYSGFDAKNISVDIAYEGNVYISEWLRAKKDSGIKKIKGLDQNLVSGHLYPSRPDVQIKELKAGQVKEHRGINGSLNLDKRVVGKGKIGLPVHIRVTWENDKGHVFDEIHKYKLLCTTAEEGHAFTFIPEGIISKKN